MTPEEIVAELDLMLEQELLLTYQAHAEGKPLVSGFLPACQQKAPSVTPQARLFLAASGPLQGQLEPSGLGPFTAFLSIG